jgi:hypothetical protein
MVVVVHLLLMLLGPSVTATKHLFLLFTACSG